ncbi:MAG TPA: peptidoglycan-binding protein [Candidatus Paceibacterota bacterium]
MTNTKKLGAGLALAAAIAVAAPSFADAATLYRSLDVGSTGSDVSALQQFLAQDSSLYPEGLVTGYYGELTKAAVTKFQARNGISTVGRVGPITMSALNAQMDGGMTVGGADMSAPMIYGISSNANNNSATVAWTTNELSKGTVYYSTSPLMVSESLHTVAVVGALATGDAGFRTSQNVSIPNLNRDTTYYYMIHTEDQSGNVSVTWPASIRTQQ